MVVLVSPVAPAVAEEATEETAEPSVAVRSVALRVHHVEKMEAFYSEAFGVVFRDVETFGIRSRFGELGGVTLKLVPIRDGVDFEGYPDVQLGLEVSDLERVLRLAERHGGRQEGSVRQSEGRLHGAVRDPDGNTIELYQSIADSE